MDESLCLQRAFTELHEAQLTVGVRRQLVSLVSEHHLHGDTKACRIVSVYLAPDCVKYWIIGWIMQHGQMMHFQD